VAQALSPLVGLHHEDQVSGSRDQIGFWLFVVTLCLLPLEYWVFPLSLRVPDAALALLMLYSLGKAWRTRQGWEFPVLLPMWLIFLASAAATLVGFGRMESVIALVQEIYICAWFFSLMNVLRTFSLPDMDRLMKIWSVVACIEAATTVMGMFRIGPSMFYTLPYRERNITTPMVRSVGTYINPNAAAVYLSVSLFIVLAASWPIWLRAVMAAWLFAGMFGTGSNGALLTTVGGLVVLVVVHAIIKVRRGILLWGALICMGAGLGAMVLCALVFVPSLLAGIGLSGSQHALSLTVGRFSRSLNDRFELIGWAWRIYSRYPVGIGPNGFSTLRASLHNDYAAFLFERGPVGLIGWLLMLGTAVLEPLWPAARLVDRSRRWQVLAPSAGIFACSINALSHEISHMRQFWMLMVFLFALSYAHLAQQANTSPGSTGGNTGPE
jgi:hypothetical protein